MLGCCKSSSCPSPVIVPNQCNIALAANWFEGPRSKRSGQARAHHRRPKGAYVAPTRSHSMPAKDTGRWLRANRDWELLRNTRCTTQSTAQYKAMLLLPTAAGCGNKRCNIDWSKGLVPRYGQGLPRKAECQGSSVGTRIKKPTMRRRHPPRQSGVPTAAPRALLSSCSSPAVAVKPPRPSQVPPKRSQTGNGRRAPQPG
jgi:hypothetical protein